MLEYVINLWLNKYCDWSRSLVVSTIVRKGETCNTKVEKVNTLLKEFCKNNSIDTISHDNIIVKKHLNKGKLHLMYV